MSYRLTKRIASKGKLTWNTVAFLDPEECVAKAAADSSDYVIENERGVIDYRIAGKGPN